MFYAYRINILSKSKVLGFVIATVGHQTKHPALAD